MASICHSRDFRVGAWAVFILYQGRGKPITSHEAGELGVLLRAALPATHTSMAFPSSTDGARG